MAGVLRELALGEGRRLLAHPAFVGSFALSFAWFVAVPEGDPDFLRYKNLLGHDRRSIVEGLGNRTQVVGDARYLIQLLEGLGLRGAAILLGAREAVPRPGRRSVHERLLEAQSIAERARVDDVEAWQERGRDVGSRRDLVCHGDDLPACGVSRRSSRFRDWAVLNARGAAGSEVRDWQYRGVLGRRGSMPDPIVYIDRSEIREGRLEEVKTAMKELAEFVETNEPQILSYAVYVD